MTNNLSQKDKKASKLSHELIAFADGLKPSIEYIAAGKALVQNVFTHLQKEKKFSISRSYIGGSVGKQTSIIYPDYDCVVFLNEKTPPMKETVQEFTEFLKREAKLLKIIPDSIKGTNVTAQVEFENGTELDLVPACSFSQEGPEKQYEEVLKRIAENPLAFWGFSSSLAETVINFLKSQDGPTHQLIRLCKYWFKSLTLDQKVYGGSTMIEILCVASVREYIEKPYYAIHALRTFFEKVAKLDEQKIAFVQEGNEWKLIPKNDFVQKKYKKIFPKDILERKSFIIEPANPYNDLSKNLKPLVLQKLKSFASKMLDRLDDLESDTASTMKTVNADGSIVIHFEKFFEPFPIRLRTEYAYSGIPVYLLLHYDYQNHASAHCKLDVNNSTSFQKNTEAQNVTKAIRNGILFLLRAKAKRNEQNKNSPIFIEGLAEMASKNDVKGAVQIFIDQNFGVKKFITESAANKDHQSYDVTLYIPYSFKSKTHAVRLSLKWEH